MIDFPSAPTVGQTYYAPSNGVTYRWDGTLWLAYPSAGPGYGPSGDFCARMTGGAIGTAMGLYSGMPVQTGNAGNWYNPATGRYQPPPGRYYIYCTFSAVWAGGAVHLQVQLRKNGVVVAEATDTAGAANWYSDPAAAGVYDANGADYFEMWGCSLGGGGTFLNITFLAFPVSGAKGPVGDKGLSGDVGALGFRRLARIVPTAGQNAIDFTDTTIPSDINDLELRYDLSPNTNNAYLYLQTYNSGVLDTASHYIYFSDYVSHNAAQGGNVTAYNGGLVTVIPLNLNTAGWGVSNLYSIQGRITVNNIRDGTRAHYFQHDCIMIESSNTYWALLKGGGIQNQAIPITGLRLYWSAGGCAARGAVSLYGSP